MTYSDEEMPVNEAGFPELRKRDVQLFKKRLRKLQDLASGDQIRYYTVGEYGTETHRPHYHSILFNLHPEIRQQLPAVWTHGNTYIGDVNNASIHYVTKYVINRMDEHSEDRAPPFALMSRRPAIGYDYLRTHTHWHQDGLRNFANVNGIQSRLPRYYKDKIFTKAQKARMGAELMPKIHQMVDDEIERLSRFHDDPYAYYNEREAYAHNRLTIDVNSNNTF